MELKIYMDIAEKVEKNKDLEEYTWMKLEWVIHYLIAVK